jgi:hypothetical protein
MKLVFPKKRWLWLLTLPVLLLVVVTGILYAKQQQIVQEILTKANDDFKGKITIERSVISPFKNFPYISIDLKELKVFETKNIQLSPIINIKDAYAGFDLWTVLLGNFEIKTIRITDAAINITLDSNNTLNIVKAFEPIRDINNIEDAFHLNFKKIILEKVQLTKTNLKDSISLVFEIDKTITYFETTEEFINLGINASFILNVKKGIDTTFIKNKHFVVGSTFHFNKETHLIDFEPSTLKMEEALFGMEGSIDFDDDFNVNLTFEGKKPNFDLLIAFAPPDLAETLNRYDNKGEIFFTATVKGKSASGFQPAIDASFGCKNGYFSNLNNQKKLDEMAFDGSFTNGKKRNLETFEFRLNDFKSRPEAGSFSGSLLVRNFITPEIDMQVNSDFNLEFLTNFLNLNNIKNLLGKVVLSMNFHDIVDINNPEKSLEKLNQAYRSDLSITNLKFRSDRYQFPVENLNLKATSEGNDLIIEYCNLQVGNSDLSLKGTLNNLPALVHQRTDEILVNILLSSSMVDIKELTSNIPEIDTPLDEKLKDFGADITLKMPASSFTASRDLPTGTLTLNSFEGKLQNYSHPIKQLTAVFSMQGNSLHIDALKARVASSDIQLGGRLSNISLWLDSVKSGKSVFEYSIISEKFQFGDIFTYKGVNYLPASMSGHEVSNLTMGGSFQMMFEKDTLQSKYFTISNFYGKFDRYPHAFHDFNALVRIYEKNLHIDRFDGMIDDSDFHITGAVENYNLWLHESKAGDTKITFDLSANTLKLKDLFSYNGANYVPEEYRDEALTQFRSKGKLDLHFNNNELTSKDLQVDLLKGKMKFHPLAFENFKGNIHFENNIMELKDVSGSLGKSNFKMYGMLHTSGIKGNPHAVDKIHFYSTHLDVDELIHYDEPTAGQTIDHDSGFNIFTLPFRNLDLHLKMDHLNYHKYMIDDLTASIRMKENHYIYFDQLKLRAASGHVSMTGYLNGSDPSNVYFSPRLMVRSVNLDEVMYKFDNFGQDMVISDNLHGILSGNISGKILMHTDLTPRLEDSDLKMDVLIEKGRLEQFEPMYALAEFFDDKNLAKILFDKLENRLVLKNGALYLPNMLINSSLGFIELSGKQDLNLQMEYYLRVPLKLVTQSTMKKLFGKKSDDVDPIQVDKIIYKDPNRRISYVNIKIYGTPDNYKISLQKNKQLIKKDAETGEEFFDFEDAEID